jgi:hypothetical protein
VLALAAASQCPKGRISFVDNPARDREKLHASDGGAGPAVCAFKQYCAEKVLDVAKPSAERRLTDIQRFRRLSQATVLRHDERPSHIQQIDGHSLEPSRANDRALPAVAENYNGFASLKLKRSSGFVAADIAVTL